MLQPWGLVLLTDLLGLTKNIYHLNVLWGILATGNLKMFFDMVGEKEENKGHASIGSNRI